ncbi:uncharacterized protein METZ01_LOCUS405319 [marine metagenome]|uniref:Uncharacterized protein n=1 Tax=marine metagenome TaxID=408172 RepID=A0A382W2G1_9ZZZZ
MTSTTPRTREIRRSTALIDSNSDWTP